MGEKLRYKALVAGKLYTIIGEEKKEQLDMVVKILNQQLEELKGLDTNMSTEEAAILMSINAINDQLKKQAELLTLKKQAEKFHDESEKIKELEEKVQKMEKVEAQARTALQEAGENETIHNPIEAQKILNQLQKEKIKQKKER